jgi:hypothetical protein
MALFCLQLRSGADAREFGEAFPFCQKANRCQFIANGQSTDVQLIEWQCDEYTSLN